MKHATKTQSQEDLATSMSRDEIFRYIQRTMVESFELDPDCVTHSATLIDDLGLDSIDAIDMAVKIQEYTGQRVAEDELRGLRTVGDAVDLVERLVRAEA
ncbi:MAG: acyl carrier protein [Myxococcota bacterium]